MKSSSKNMHYWLFIPLLFISNITLSMETIFEVENNSTNRSIIQMSSALTNLLENVNLNQTKIHLSMIKDPATWKCMELLYTSSSKKPVLKELKKLKKEKLFSLSKDCDSLDINLYIKKEDHKDEKINLLDLCRTALAKKLAKKIDITTQISQFPPILQTKLAISLLKEIFKYSTKMIRSPHSCSYMEAFGSAGNIMISHFNNNGRLYNFKTKEITTLESHLKAINLVAISLDETLGFTGSYDNTVKICDTKTGTCLRTLSYDSKATAMACNNNATQLICGYKDGTVKIWNIADGSCALTFQHLLTNNTTNGVKAVAFNKTGTHIIAADFYTAKIYCTKTGQCIKELAHQNEVTAVAFSSDGTKAVTGSKYYAFLWDLNTATCIRTFGEEPQNNNIDAHWIISVQLSDDNKRLCIMSSESTIPYREVWDTNTGEYISTIGTTRVMSSGFFIPNNDFLHSDLLEDILKDPTEEEKKITNDNSSKESVTLLRALWISHIFRNYTKNNELYYVPHDGPVDVIIKNIKSGNTARFLFDNLGVKYPKPWTKYALKKTYFYISTIFKTAICICAIYYWYRAITDLQKWFA